MKIKHLTRTQIVNRAAVAFFVLAALAAVAFVVWVCIYDVPIGS
jgi:hypothetical protein